MGRLTPKTSHGSTIDEHDAEAVGRVDFIQPLLNLFPPRYRIHGICDVISFQQILAKKQKYERLPACVLGSSHQISGMDRRDEQNLTVNM